MYVSERYCSPQGFCAYKDGDRGLGRWYLFPGALQSTTQSQGVMESALHLRCAPFLPNPGTSSHLSSLPYCPTVGGLLLRGLHLARQAARLLTPRCLRPSSQVSLAGKPPLLVDFLSPRHGSPVLAVPEPSMLTNCPREPVLTVFSCEGKLL